MQRIRAALKTSRVQLVWRQVEETDIVFISRHQAMQINAADTGGMAVNSHGRMRLWKYLHLTAAPAKGWGCTAVRAFLSLSLNHSFMCVCFPFQCQKHTIHSRALRNSASAQHRATNTSTSRQWKAD